ncbi:MAG: stage V sporulation protein AB [Butyrivibrio sp.]
MWIRIVLMAFFGLSAGVATASGYFALIASIGVITRFAQYTNTANRIRWYESMIIIGAAVGNALFVFMPHIVVWNWVIAVYGVFAGIFIGCFLVSLAEAVKSIPIFVRRARLTTGLCIVIIFFALGKGIGSLFYFMHDMMG